LQAWYVRFKNISEAIVDWTVEKPTPENTDINIGLLRDWPFFKVKPSKAILQPDESMDVKVIISYNSIFFNKH